MLLKEICQSMEAHPALTKLAVSMVPPGALEAGRRAWTQAVREEMADVVENHCNGLGYDIPVETATMVAHLVLCEQCDDYLLPATLGDASELGYPWSKNVVDDPSQPLNELVGVG